MSERLKKISWNILYAIIIIALVLSVWLVAAKLVGSELVLPGISDTFAALTELLVYKTFWAALSGTLIRALIAYAASVAVFFALFYFCTAYYGFRRVAEPIISAFRTLPTMAVALLFAIWVGGYIAPIVLGTFVVVPQLYSAVSARNATVESELKEICKLNGSSRPQTFKALYLPHAAAGFPESFASSLSFCIKIVIAAEILMQTANSLGMLMKLSQVYFETASLIAMTVMAVLVSVAAEYLLRFILGKLLSVYR